MGSRGVVVLDTNVLVAALGWRGPENLIYNACREGVCIMAISPPLLAELRRVLTYPKFQFTEAEVARFDTEIRDHALLVESRLDLQVVTVDPDDNRVLECAIAADAERIVSGDPHLLQLGSFRGIQIITAREALIAYDIEAS